MQRTKLLISGKVQGVYYRQSMLNFTSNFPITGYVCNLPTGQVLAEIQGNAADIQQILTWCHSGPEMANVTSLEKEDMELVDSEKVFEIRR
ncbi:MAG: acylphosphatase [Litorivivens sp.]|jgi:acylphosphatase